MMTYFMKEADREGSCFFEFQKGNWRKEKKHWKKDSIVIDEMEFADFLCDIITEVIPRFDYYGATIVSENQWNKIKEKAMEMGGETLTAVEEADAWAKETFREHDCFTILGI